MSERTLKLTLSEPVASHVANTLTSFNTSSFKGASPHPSSPGEKTLTFEIKDGEGIHSVEGQWKAAIECLADGIANVLRLEGVDANFPE